MTFSVLQFGNLDEIWSTLSTLSGAGPRTFWGWLAQ